MATTKLGTTRDRVASMLARRTRWLSRATRRRWEALLAGRVVGIGVVLLGLALGGLDSKRPESKTPPPADETPPPFAPADVHLGAVDHGRTHVPAEFDRDLARVNGPAERPATVEMELVRGRAPAHGHAPADVHLAAVDFASDGERAGAVDSAFGEVYKLRNSGLQFRSLLPAPGQSVPIPPPVPASRRGCDPVRE